MHCRWSPISHAWAGTGSEAARAREALRTFIAAAPSRRATGFYRRKHAGALQAKGKKLFPDPRACARPDARSDIGVCMVWSFRANQTYARYTPGIYQECRPNAEMNVVLQAAALPSEI
jgi:hypothetical protein